MKLLSLLKALDPSEHKDFEKFLKSPFFSESEHCLTFFKYLRKRYPDFDLEKTDVEAAYRKCSAKQTPTESKFYNLTSHLSHLLENFFLVGQALDGNGDASRPRRERLATALARRNAADYFQAEAQRLIDEIEKKQLKDAADFEALQRVYHALYFHPDISQIHAGAPDLEGAFDHLSLYYFMSAYRLLAEMKTRKNLVPDQLQTPLERLILEQTADPVLQAKHPLIHIYRRLVKLLDEPSDEAGFRALKTLFLANFDLISSLERRYLLKHLVNYGALLARQRYPVQAELLDLYKKTIEAGALLVAGRLTYVAYLNIANLSISTGDQAWGERFAKEFAPFLEENLRHCVSKYAQALLHYSNDDLEAAHEQLDSSVFVAPIILECRCLLIKIAFDRYVRLDKDKEFLFSSLKSYEKHLTRQEMAQEKKDAYLNFVRFARKLARKKSSTSKISDSNKLRLKDKLKKMKTIIASKWLEERIDGL